MDLGQRLSRAGRSGVLMALTPMAASFATQVWIGRTLGRAGLGEYHAASLFVIVLSTLIPLGFPVVVAQRVAALEGGRRQLVREQENTAFTLALLFAALVTVVSILVWPTFARAFGLRRDLPLALLAAASFASAVANVVTSVLLAKLRIRDTTLVVLAQPLAVAVAIAAARPIVNLDGTSLALLGFVATGAVGVSAWLADGVRPRFESRVGAGLLAGSLHATLWTYPSVITGWVDRSIIGVILGPSALGAFVAASTLVEGLQRLTRGLTDLAIPTYARLVSDRAGSKRILDSHIRLVSGLLIVAGAVFIAAGSGFLRALFGESFAIATTTLRLLAITLLPLGIAIAVASYGVGSDRAAGAGRTLLLLVPVHFIVGTVSTALFHIAGTALADLIIWTIGALLYVLHARRRGIPIQGRTLLHVVGVSVPTFVIAWILGSAELHFALSGVGAFLIAAAAVSSILVREPERRLVRRLAGIAQ